MRKWGSGRRSLERHPQGIDMNGRGRADPVTKGSRGRKENPVRQKIPFSSSNAFLFLVMIPPTHAVPKAAWVFHTTVTGM